MNNRLPISILTGFLGAGKTTFLNRLLKEPEMAGYAVIINEFGDIALDHLLVEKSDDGLIELSSGCICCSMRGELVDTLERLVDYHLNEEPLKGIIIETSGVADPLPILQALLAHPFLSSILDVGNVLTLVDAAHGLETLERQPVFMRQIVLADRLLISKCDLYKGGIPSNLFAQLREINFSAVIETVDKVKLSSCLLPFDNEQKQFDERLDKARSFSSHGNDMTSFSLVRDGAISLEALMAFLELLASAHGAGLLRVKGLVAIEGKARPLLVQGVRSFFHTPVFLESWPDDNKNTRLVFIVDGVEADFIARLFDGFCSIPQVDSADREALMNNPLAISGFSDS